jgi:hypothetical protein
MKTEFIPYEQALEIKEWIDRWSRLEPSPQRDMTIKIWHRLL